MKPPPEDFMAIFTASVVLVWAYFFLAGLLGGHWERECEEEVPDRIPTCSRTSTAVGVFWPIAGPYHLGAHLWR